MSNCILKVKNVYKNYKEQNSTVIANENISFDLYEGEILALLGHNGAGKTTLMRQIIGLLEPDKGTIELEKENINIGYLNQKRVSIFWHLTAEEAIYYSCCLKGLSMSRSREETGKWLAFLDLAKIKKMYIRNLSGGEQQLVDLAIALINNPKILILDEPTAQVDPSKRKFIWDIIFKLNISEKTTVILVTHNLNEAEIIANRIIVMAQAKILVEGSLSELKKIVDNKIYIEIIEKSNLPIDFDIKNKLQKMGELKYGRCENEYIFIANRAKLSEIFSVIGNKSMLDCFEDFKVRTASLEDIYMKIHEG